MCFKKQFSPALIGSAHARTHFCIVYTCGGIGNGRAVTDTQNTENGIVHILLDAALFYPLHYLHVGFCAAIAMLLWRGDR
jgi:hypothetical protein